MNYVPELGPGDPWLTITELAQRQGLGKSTISEKVKALEASGRLKTRRGRGREKLVSLPQFLAATAADGDPGRELAADMREDRLPGLDQPDGAASPGYRDAQARKAQAEAALREFDLLQKQGELVAIADLKAEAETCAESIAAVIERLPTRAADMAAAVGREGERGARMQYRRDARHLRTAIVAAFDRLLASFPALTGARLSPPADLAPAWGDLDPAEYAADR